MTSSFTNPLTSIIVIFLFSISNPLTGQNYITKGDGSWNSINTWEIEKPCTDNPSGAVPPLEKSWGCGVDVKIKHKVTYPGHLSNFGNGFVNGLELLPGTSLTVNGDFVLPASAWGSVTYLILGEGSSLKVTGTLNLGRTGDIVIPRNASVLVENLIVDSNNPKITIEEGAELIVLNQTTIKDKRIIDVKGNFKSKTLINNGQIISSGIGTTLIEGDVLLNTSSSLVFTGNSKIVSGGNMITNGAGSMLFTGSSAISFAGNMTLSQGSQYKFADNSSVATGGSLEATGGAAITFEDRAQGKIAVNLSLRLGANIHLNHHAFLSSGGNLKLDDGTRINISGSSEGYIKGDVDMKNGEVSTSGSATFFVDGKLIAYRDLQVKATEESQIYICDYPNFTPKESKYVSVQPSSYYGPGCGKLPVNWMAVDIISATEKNVLTWTTATEWENSHFEIERSTNGTDTFEKIGEISGTGWSNSITSYSYEDRHLQELAGYLYYRIKQVDFNGNIDYSKVVVLKFSNKQPASGEWEAYPNPNKGSNLKVCLSGIEGSTNEYIDMRLISSSTLSEPVWTKYGNDLNAEISRAFGRAPRGLVIIELVFKGKVSHLKVLKN